MSFFNLIQLIASVLIPVIMFIVTTTYQTGLRQRNEILEKLDKIADRQSDLDRRITRLEAEWDSFDPHPSRPSRSTS